ncbi:MAG: MG2 domain-containing protein [Luteolibacter sp.]|uniref:alpha-2-macroglobulin family protein n=1 Tax=Luteolibacter sp. TaxID=1962973 RepID=UPI0032664E1E
MAQEPEALRAERDKLKDRGMWRDVVNFYVEKLLPLSDAGSGSDLERATEALGRLNAWNELDGLVERAVSAHPENPSLLTSAANVYQHASHYGQIIAGEFTRSRGYGGRGFRGGEDDSTAESGQAVNTQYRDHIRELQLLRQAVSHPGSAAEGILAWREIAETFIENEPWKLQTLTPLDKLPEWGEPGPEGGTEGAPWAGDAPVVYEVPASWEAAKNDGERWRLALAEQVRLSTEVDMAAVMISQRARFSESQFGTETLSSYGWWAEQDPDSAKGILEMDTLAEDECLAKTSDGVRRFKLSAEYHFIALYRSILDNKLVGGTAGDALTEAFLNRRQYDKAREVLEQTIAKFGPGDGNSRKKLLQQIIGNWGRFEPAETVAAGTKPKLPLVFRNASNIKLSAAPVDMEAVIKDTQEYLRSNPAKFDWERPNPSNIASRLISGNADKYIGKPAASWETKLAPRDKHRDTRMDLTVPLDKAGAWWISGTIENGNSFQTLVWIVDSVIVDHDVGGKKQWWVADAAGGAPVAGADLEFFGYRTLYLDRSKPLERNMNILTKDLALKTDADGKSLLAPGALDDNYQWLVIARKPDRTMAFYGFRPFSITEPQLENGNRDMTYGISDRPLYKPGDTAHLKFYLRNVGYFQPDESRWANKTGTLIVTNGRGEEAMKIEKLKTDDLGAVESEVVIPKDAVLGTWNATFQIGNQIAATVSLRVEEYRKPEYEVKVEAPTEPVKLGDKFTATVKATYFHGSPVRNADVEIIVKRSSIGERWFPVWRWDWLYGSGAWWNCGDASWHPTWSRWGCIPPHPSWWQGNRWTPDELVMKRHMAIGPDGTAKIEIDTAPAKQTQGDMDSKYTIEARVVDASRREERGTGSVIAARKPFEVIVWTDRGYTRAGESVEATVSAATLAGKPVVAAKGTLKIFQIVGGENGRVEEKEVQSFPVETDAQGEIHQKFAAPVTGQYRLAASLSFKDGEAAEGATILNVHGPGRADPKDWHFGPLELIADKTTHAAGETLKLRVNSDKEDANVWLFLHIAGTAGREARRIQLDGKSLEVEVPLDLRDMPNMFIEGVTVFGAEVHTAVRQILLPPVSKLIEVTLEPAKDRVKPREASALRVTLRDAEGKPVTGIAVLSVYDKSLEAITGGSNVGLIHENFWTWKNNYYQNWNMGSVPNSPGNLLRPKAAGMESLGRFGDQTLLLEKSGGFGGGGGRSRMAAKGMAFGRADSAPMPATAMPMEAKDEMLADKDTAAEAAPNPNPILVRKDFADLLKWSGAIQTDADGHAEIPLEFPDNLTTWKARVWVLGKGTQVGEGSAEIITSKELLVRLQAPRFLVERDESVFSAVVQNDHDAAKTVKVSLELDGNTLEAIDGAPQTVEIAAKSEARVDWRVKALHEGEAKFRMRADSGDDGDAVERTLPVRVHGMLRQDAWSRTVEPGKDSASISVDVPAERRPDQSKLAVRFSPTIAGAVVDAIPYLADYPYGCTEQTLNRFVPAVIAQKMLKDLKINLSEVKAKRTNLNPQELGDSAERAAQWKQWQTNPVFDEVEMDKMVAKGVEKLMSMQNSDGGWGWFSGYGEVSYPHTTAVVVHGLLAAKGNGAKIPDAMLNAGSNWLTGYERKQVAALQLYVEREALRKEGKKVPDDNKYEKPSGDAVDAFVRVVLGEAKRNSEPMLAFLYRDRVGLPVYAKCLLGLEEHRTGDEARRDEVMKMISQFLKRDAENQTAYLDLQNNTYWWNWYGSEVEAHAWYLKLLAAVKPNDPDTRGLVKYLVNNRKHASYWESTRDTAFAVEAIAAYFKASGEDAPEMEVEILMDGKSLRKVSINRDNLFTYDGSVVLTGDAVATGKHDIELRRSGKGTLYANAYLQVFTLEDKLRAAGLEVKVSRRVSKLIALEKETEVPDSTGLVAKQQVERFRREPLEDGAKLASGDRIEVELILISKNDYEYLIFSDAKAAGFEALDALSGYVGGSGGFSVYMEPRDQTVDFFVRALPRGMNTVRYQLRAESPGIYKALPATVEAMYAPELRANSEDLRLEIMK